MKGFCVFLIGLGSFLFADVPGTVQLFNDSSYVLTVVVFGADGTYLGQDVIQPGHQQTFTTTFYSTGLTSPSAPPVSMTPYMVLWKCPNGNLYSRCHQVSPGSLVSANTCPGVYYCEQEKDQRPVQKTKK